MFDLDIFAGGILCGACLIYLLMAVFVANLFFIHVDGFLCGGQGFPEDFDAAALMAELEEVKDTVKTQESRITELESRIAALERAAISGSDEVDDCAAKDEDD